MENILNLFYKTIYFQNKFSKNYIQSKICQTSFFKLENYLKEQFLKLDLNFNQLNGCTQLVHSGILSYYQF